MKKIIVLFHGGLGNQLYQYCFYRWVQERYQDRNILADISEYLVLHCHQGFELFKVFPKIGINVAGKFDLYKIYGEIPRCYGGYGKRYIENIRQALNRNFFKVKDENVFESKASYGREDIEKAIENGKLYLSGYWQDKNYYLENMDFILEELTFKKLVDEQNIQYKNWIQNCNSVSIHVRRGDYIAAGLPLAGVAYYKRAVQIIYEKVNKPIFFLFSDDKDYLRHEFDWLEDKVIIENNTESSSYIDMQLMSYCKHNILANSTFSTWGALLNRNKDKIVIFPKQREYKKMMLDDWIMVE